jgi:IS30 family transposase
MLMFSKTSLVVSNKQKINKRPREKIGFKPPEVLMQNCLAAQAA